MSPTPPVYCRLGLWTQHIALTVFMSFVLTYCMGTVLEMHARQSFMKRHRLEALDWQPGVLPRLLMQALQHLSTVKSRLLRVLGLHRKHQAKMQACKQGLSAEGVDRRKGRQLLAAAGTDEREARPMESGKRCSATTCAKHVNSASCPGTQCQSVARLQISAGCASDSASRCSTVKEDPADADSAQLAERSGCCPSAPEADLAHAHRDVSLAVGYQGRVCGEFCSLSASSSVPACSRSDSSSDADVSEAQEVCCGVQGMQAQACQKLLNKEKALDSKCKQLTCRCVLFTSRKQWHIRQSK